LPEGNRSLLGLALVAAISPDKPCKEAGGFREDSLITANLRHHFFRFPAVTHRMCIHCRRLQNACSCAESMAEEKVSAKKKQQEGAVIATVAVRQKRTRPVDPDRRQFGRQFAKWSATELKIDLRDCLIMWCCVSATLSSNMRQSPDWMPIIPNTGSLFHAETHSANQLR
jgi:hypothetical protein